MSGAPSSERRYLIPECVQTSEMDCGPASLKAMLAGYGINANYGRLREACQTAVDGTSIDTLEEVAGSLGLIAEQIMLPADHLLLEEAKALPATVVVRLPNGLAHFVVVWRCHGPWVQVMDPGTGRQWLPKKRLLESLFTHRFPVPAAGWRDWAGSDGFLAPLCRRLTDLKIPGAQAQGLIDRALEDASWRGLAALDAATRLVTSIVATQALAPGEEARRVIERFFVRGLEPQHPIAGDAPGGVSIPAAFWSVEPLPVSAETPAPPPEDAGEPMLALRGAVLVRIAGRRHGPVPAVETGQQDAGEAAVEQERAKGLTPELAAVLEQPADRPERAVLRALREDGLLAPAVVITALLMATAGTMLQALLIQGLMRVGMQADSSGYRMIGLIALLVLVALLFLMEVPIAAAVLRAGRRLETRLRIVFLSKIPRLGDRYFHSRLTSDMTMRAFSLNSLHQLPSLGQGIIRLCFQLILTTVGLMWFEPGAAATAAAATIAFIAISFLSSPPLQGRELRVSTHASALSRFYLDALLGLVPLRTHCAERAFRREHEGMLVAWVRAALDYARLGLIVQSIGAVVYAGFSVWLAAGFIARGGEPSALLLLLYWTLSLPALGQTLVQQIQQYPAVRNHLLRTLEPLGAPDEIAAGGQPSVTPSVTPTGDVVPSTARRSADPPRRKDPAAARVEMHDLTVLAGGHEILRDIDLAVDAGAHIAVVGPSGAGKSSLVGILLGWHRPASGVCLVDGVPLLGASLQQLRRETAWVDPAVQLWNRSLLDNLVYGNRVNGNGGSALNVAGADLFDVIERLPAGLQTVLGEGGGLVSGGEGQRVRLGRAMNRGGARLVILDEPFRGLDRGRRRELLLRAREHWHEATLICITHDVAETQGFERVLVVEDGRIVEDGHPAALAAQPASRYRAMLDAEEAVRTGLWEGQRWRRLWIEQGRLTEQHRPGS